MRELVSAWGQRSTINRDDWNDRSFHFWLITDWLLMDPNVKSLLCCKVVWKRKETVSDLNLCWNVTFRELVPAPRGSSLTVVSTFHSDSFQSDYNDRVTAQRVSLIRQTSSLIHIYAALPLSVVSWIATNLSVNAAMITPARQIVKCLINYQVFFFFPFQKHVIMGKVHKDFSNF